jgi:chromosome segregation ATPase
LGELETTRTKLKDTQAQLDDARAQLNEAAVFRALCSDLKAKVTECNLTQAALEEKEAELKSVKEELELEKARSAKLGSIDTDFMAAQAKLEALHKELESEKTKSTALECLREELAAEKKRSAKVEANFQAKQAELTTELNDIKTKLNAELEDTQLKLRHSQGKLESVSDKLEIIQKDLKTERGLTSQLESQLWKARMSRTAAWGLGFTQGFDTLRDLVEGGPPKMDISKLDAEDFVPGSETLEALAALEDNIAQDCPSASEGVLHEEDPAEPGTGESQSSSSSDETSSSSSDEAHSSSSWA